MKIYIDVTNLLRVNYLTGIQRVVREVVLRMLQYENDAIVLLNYVEGHNLYERVNNQAFCSYFDCGEGKHSDIVTGIEVTLDELKPGDIFFDIDSVWNLSLRRSVLLPKLKANGVKLVVYVYDIIPITHPQFCHGDTIFNFMNYIGAYLQHADLIIASAQSTLDAIAELLIKLDLPQIPSVVSWLGSDFKIQNQEEREVHPDAIKAVESGRYVLMVGTIEPRKNHSLILDAFDNKLFSKNINLVFAGGIGWNIEEFQKRMEQHPKLNHQFYHLKGMNDATIDYLYKHAYCVAFPTFNEGFGLPVIESFQRGTPVLASDIPILREVGGEYCAYFNPNSWEDFSDELLKWIENEDNYIKYKEKVQTYEPVTWDEVTQTIWDSLISLKESYPYEMPDEVKQMVYLTARKEDLLETLPFVENFMPFIKEIVLCCPDKMVEAVNKEYQGRLQIKYLTDSQVLGDEKLPQDHTMRNFFLRCLAMKQDILDDAFIMSDDDYRPLHLISQEVFLKDGIYQAYYCYHLGNWKGDQGNLSSFDQSMHRTYKFLKEYKYSTWMYDSHMPQIIDRRVFLELLNKHPGIERQGYSDWSMYFNYMNTLYPNQVENQAFVTVSWPGIPSAWNMEVLPSQLLFENYYRELYTADEVFAGFSTEYYEGIENENVEKVVRYLNVQAEHNQARAMFNAYCANYEMLYGEYPLFNLIIKEDDCEIKLPQYVAIAEKEFTRVPLVVDVEHDSDEMIELSYNYLDIHKNVFLKGANMVLKTTSGTVEIPVKGTFGGFKGILEIRVKYKKTDYKEGTRLCVMKKGL